MDCNDNDILRQNFQLAGEGRSKSSSVLRPYDFPKFDFDDSLQTHLRFDSLVETEVFLGIQSQEDNQWVEDFSRGTNGMEFNSTPADSCSISRRKNVWSEATSSESVEMLLKSVGQDEMMPMKSDIPESNASCDQDTSTKHVEFGSELVTKNVQCPENVDSSLPQDDILKDCLATKGHVELLPEVEDPSAPRTNVLPICGKGATLTNEGIHACDDEKLKELNMPVKKSTNFEAIEDASCFTEVGDVANSNLVKHSTSELLEQANANASLNSCNDDVQGKHVCTATEQGNSKILEEMACGSTVHIRTVNSSPDSVEESEVQKSQDAVEKHRDGVEETANVKAYEESESNSSVGDQSDVSFATSVQTCKDEVKVLPDSEMAGSSKRYEDGMIIDGTGQHSTELSSELHMRLDQKMGSSGMLTCGQNDNKMEEVQANRSEIGSTYEMPMFSVDSNKVPVGSSACIDETNSNKSSNMVVLSSTDETRETETSGSCHIDSTVDAKKSHAHLTCAIIGEHQLGFEREVAHDRADLCETGHDICNIDEGRKLPIVSGNTDPSNIGPLINDDQRTHSLCKSDRFSGDTVDKSRHHASSAIESGNDAAPSGESNTTAALGGLTENENRELDLISLSHPHNNTEEGISRIRSDIDFRTEVVTEAKVEVSVADDSAKTPLSEMAVDPLQPVQRFNDVKSNNTPSTEAKVHLDCHKSNTMEESLNADVSSCRNHEETAMQVEGENEPACTVEVDKASCGSPTIISISKPLLMERVKQEAKGSEVIDQFVKNNQFPSKDPKRKDATPDDSTFTFEVNALPEMIEREHGRSWPPFANVEKCSSSGVVEEAKLTSDGKTPATRKGPHQSTGLFDSEHVHGASRGTSERRGRRASSKGMARENARKGSLVKDTKQEIAKGDKVSNTLLSTSPHSQFGQKQLHGHIEQSNTKTSGAIAVSDFNASSLHDSKSLSASFRQPFSDLQQVQLRAQIFVYGSLIQGSAPDEACMSSAFGSSDGRSIWEPVWQAAVERVRNQKSNSSAAETPLLSQPGARASDVTLKQSSHSSKVPSSPVIRAGSKSTPAAVGSPIIPLSSPLWSISTPLRDSFPSGAHKGPIVDYQHSVMPLHSYQTPPTKNFIGHTTWPSQPCFPGPWLASPQASALNSSLCFQPVTMTETVKLTSVKNTSPPLASGMKHATSSPAQTAGPGPVYVGVSVLPDSKSKTLAEKPSDSKPKKRKKVQASDPGLISVHSEARMEPVVDSNAATIMSPPVAPASASPAPGFMLCKATADTSAVSSADLPKSDLPGGKAAICSEETLSKVAEAKSYAEDAAALAAADVSRSEDLWMELAKQKETGMTSDAEAKLAAAAVAIAAAASVAKAAAAAAKVAHNVALQAKLMADEAFLSGLIPSCGKLSTDVHDINATPTSILKGDNIISESSSILVAAKEAAKKKVEAASAAAKQAENLDAIVKAAELAAAAVSQAGKIVAMGEPFPLSDLVEAGPESYWKSRAPTLKLAEKMRISNEEEAGATGVEDGNVIAKSLRGDTMLNKGVMIVGHEKVHSKEGSSDGLVSTQMGESDLLSGKSCKASVAANSDKVVSDSDTRGPQTNNIVSLGARPEGCIKEGSTVEVFKHGGGLKSAWYCANVLTLENGKAYVCYTDIPSDKGSGNLCEWVPLEGEGDQAPIVRAAHPVSASQFQGTRKRRRAALGDYAWCIGDRVDVWIDDCWWEGVVTEKNEKDETTLKVHFPVQGDTSTVRAWNLRASRFWNDGKWVECSSKGHNASKQCDTPQEKRQKLSPVLNKGKGKLASDVDPASDKPEGSKLLDLSTSDTVFDVGKTNKEDNKRTVRRPVQNGPQKGSRVIFGVPKPTGKKRKFMEVSKHFSAKRSDKSNETTDSVKFAKYLVPQVAATRGWKVPSKNECREKLAAESRSRVPSSRKSNRTLLQRDNLNSTMGQHKDKSKDNGNNMEDSIGHGEDTSEKVDQGSATEESAEAPLSSLIAQSLSTSSKKIPFSYTKSERRGKLVPSGGKLSKIEEGRVHAYDSCKVVPEVSEPRRSNRRTQPTHRLLEGLQSSMIIPKMPSVSHDKGQKTASQTLSARGKQL